jgi:hypothetical protein
MKLRKINRHEAGIVLNPTKTNTYRSPLQARGVVHTENPTPKKRYRSPLPARGVLNLTNLTKSKSYRNTLRARGLVNAIKYIRNIKNGSYQQKTIKKTVISHHMSDVNEYDSDAAKQKKSRNGR